LHCFDEPVDEPVVGVEVQVAELQQCIAVEGSWQRGKHHVVVLQAHPQGVAPPALAQSESHQHRRDQAMDRHPILEMEEVGAPAQDSRLMLALEAEAVTQMGATDARLERSKLSTLFLAEVGEPHA